MNKAIFTIEDTHGNSPLSLGAVMSHKNNRNEKLGKAKDLIKSLLIKFIPRHQLLFVIDALRGEEWEFFADKMIELAATIEKMPKATARNQETVYLHYFGGAANWWITGKDFVYTENPDGRQFQAFGKADLFGGGDCEEYGYISIDEICTLGQLVELDFHWTPKSATECGHRG